MANISGIEGFIIKGLYPASPTATQWDVSEDFSELVKKFPISETGSATTAKLITYDFKDANNDGELWDSDNEVASQTQTLGTGGDRINVGGTDYFAVDIARIKVNVEKNDGTIIPGSSSSNGQTFTFRAFKLDNGDVILRPLDGQVADWKAAGTTPSEWKSLIVTQVSGGNAGTDNVTTTTMALEDDAFTCFVCGVMIQTTGNTAVPVESLSVGDMVLTRDHGLQPVRWIGSRKLSAAELAAFPKLRPICIKAGALGKNKPDRDLMVSPQHRVLVRSKIAQRMLNADEVLVAAKHLLELDGVELADDLAAGVEYFHILFDQHEVIISNGAETESLYTGPQALRSLGEAAREEIFTLFPDLRDQDIKAGHLPARPLTSGRTGRQLSARHRRNNRSLVS